MVSAEHDLVAARDTMRSMEEQLAALYEHLAPAPTRETREAMVESLNAQVCALIDEKAELERRLADAVRPSRPVAHAYAAA